MTRCEGWARASPPLLPHIHQRLQDIARQSNDLLDSEHGVLLGVVGMGNHLMTREYQDSDSRIAGICRTLGECITGSAAYTLAYAPHVDDSLWRPCVAVRMAVGYGVLPTRKHERMAPSLLTLDIDPTNGFGTHYLLPGYAMRRQLGDEAFVIQLRLTVLPTGALPLEPTRRRSPRKKKSSGKNTKRH